LLREPDSMLGLGRQANGHVRGVDVVVVGPIQVWVHG